MRRVLLIAILALCAAVAAVVPSDAAWRAAASARSAPSVRLSTLQPLTLRGAGFRAKERVRVTLSVRTLRADRIVRTDAVGRFTYRPQTLIALDPCRGTIVVRAVGLSSARQAIWQRRCRPPDRWP